MRDCSSCNKACSPEDRERCANLLLFEAGFRPDAYPVKLPIKAARQRRFEEEKIVLLRDLPRRDLVVVPDPA